MKSDLDKKTTKAAFHLAALQGWSDLTLEQVAKAAKLPIAQVRNRFKDTNALLPVMIQQIDAEVALSVGRPDRTTSPRDRLFEIMMARFDLLQKNRKAIQNIMTEAKRNPSLIRLLLSAQAEAMESMLALAGLKQDGFKKHVAIAGLLAIYGVTLCRWRKDTTKDLSKTMATLDRLLRGAEKMGRWLEIES